MMTSAIMPFVGIQHGAAVGDGENGGLLIGDDDEGGAERLAQVQDQAVEPGEGLVQHQDRRATGEQRRRMRCRPGESDRAAMRGFHRKNEGGAGHVQHRGGGDVQREGGAMGRAGSVDGLWPEHAQPQGGERAEAG